MPTTQRTLEELSKLGQAIYDLKVRPNLKPEDHGKFVAVDVESGDFDIDDDDYTAIMRLRARRPDADIWLMRAGFLTTCRIGGLR